MADCLYCGCDLTIPPEELQKIFREEQSSPERFSYAICRICDVIFLLEDGKIVDEFEEVDSDAYYG